MTERRAPPKGLAGTHAPGSPAHKKYATFDDSEAYDCNITHDLDQGLPALAARQPTATTLGSTYPGIKVNSLGSVLLDHLVETAPSAASTDIQVTSGDRVVDGQRVGTVSSTGANGVNHLHASFYQKETVNGVEKLVSKRVSLSPRTSRYRCRLRFRSP